MARMHPQDTVFRVDAGEQTNHLDRDSHGCGTNSIQNRRTFDRLGFFLLGFALAGWLSGLWMPLISSAQVSIEQTTHISLISSLSNEGIDSDSVEVTAQQQQSNQVLRRPSGVADNAIRKENLSNEPLVHRTVLIETSDQATGGNDVTLALSKEVRATLEPTVNDFKSFTTSSLSKQIDYSDEKPEATKESTSSPATSTEEEKSSAPSDQIASSTKPPMSAPSDQVASSTRSPTKRKLMRSKTFPPTTSLVFSELPSMDEHGCFFADGSSRKDHVNRTFLTTIVSAFFRFSSKHTSEQYNFWISNFMKVEAPMVIYTNSNETMQLLIALRPPELRSRLYLCKASLFDLEAFTDYGEEGWRQVERNDRLISHHKSYLLYLVYHGKIEYVMKTINENNVYRSQFYQWHDIGCMREFEIDEIPVKGWPDPDMVRTLCGTGKVMLNLAHSYFMEKFCGYEGGKLTTVERFRNDSRFNLTDNIQWSQATVAGSQFCGTPESLKTYSQHYKRVLRLAVESGHNGGMDDQIIMALLLLSQPDIVSAVWPTRKHEWFYFNQLERPISDQVRRDGAPLPYQILNCATMKKHRG